MEDIKILNYPDKDFELFWISFKTLLIKYSTDEEKENIQIISDYLNIFKKKGNITKIKTIILKYILNVNTIGYKIIKSKNYYDIALLYYKLQKWIKISGLKYDDTFLNSVFYIFLEIMQKCSVLVLKNPSYNYIINIITDIDFPKYTQENIKNIIQYSLKNNMHYIIDITKKLYFNNIYLFMMVFEDNFINFLNQKVWSNPLDYSGKKLCLIYNYINGINNNNMQSKNYVKKIQKKPLKK